MASPGAAIATEELLVAGIRVFVRRTPGEGIPAVFVHGHPTHSEDWVPFMERMPGPAIALDLPGWGRSERPGRARLETSMHGLAGFFERFLDAAGVGEYRLACHDWGVISLIAAQRHPERVRRLVVINGVPLVPGYRWHWVARYAWRRRVLGELANLTASRLALRLISREASGTPGPMPEPFIDQAWEGWTRGTWPQALALYRSADPDRLAVAGADLGLLTCPALVVWGMADPYLPAKFGRAFAERLPNAELLEVPRAGHWPWIDQPAVIDSVCEFLSR